MEKILREEVNKLSFVCRRAIEACVLDERPQLEAATALNMSVATMKSRVFRGKRMLGRSIGRRLASRHGSIMMQADHHRGDEMPFVSPN